MYIWHSQGITCISSWVCNPYHLVLAVETIYTAEWNLNRISLHLSKIIVAHRMHKRVFVISGYYFSLLTTDTVLRCLTIINLLSLGAFWWLHWTTKPMSNIRCKIYNTFIADNITICNYRCFMSDICVSLLFFFFLFHNLWPLRIIYILITFL